MFLLKRVALTPFVTANRDKLTKGASRRHPSLV